METQRVTFKGSLSSELVGRIDRPETGEPRAYALFAHCFTCSKNLKAVVNIARALTSEGIAVFRFDFTGLGESEGDFADTSFSSNVDDLLAAIDYLKDSYEAPRILIGHSWGGTAVLQVAGQVEACLAVSTIAAPFDPAHVEHLFESKRSEIEEQGEATVNLAGRSFTIRKQFLDDLQDESLKLRLKALKKPLMIFHSPIDNIVSIDNAAKIFTAAKHPKSFISLDDADHLLTRETDSIYVGGLIAEWAGRYL